MNSEKMRLDRATGALWGVAIGDALGMPSQTLTRTQISDAYGWIDDFVDPVGGHPVSHGLKAGAITDDTEQTLLLARHLLAHPDRFDETGWARLLLDWEDGIRQRGLHDLLGPSTKKALQALLAGTPVSETGVNGNTNGASMRIVPVAIATPVEPMDNFLDRIEQTCRVTHNTAEALSAASAVAAVVSAGVDGASFEDAVPLALSAAREAAKRGARRGEVDMAGLIETATGIGGEDRSDAVIDRLEKEIGNSVLSRESVAAAFGVAMAAKGDAWRAAVLAANIGDDTDTIGAIAAGMVAACTGAAALPQEKKAIVAAVNKFDPGPVAEGLLAIRANRGAGS
ncbi:MAG: ADP-ribosylglycohydrolase family protein [Alphaproteobacteria bacterium]